MIAGGNATVYVSDMDRAVRFYVETLGFKLVVRHAEHGQGGLGAEVDAGGGLILGLHPASPHAPKPGTSGSISIGLAVNAPIAEVVAVLSNRGVVFQGPIMENGPIKLAYFGDPDGTSLYLRESSY